MYETIIYLVLAYAAAFALDRAYNHNGKSPSNANVEKKTPVSESANSYNSDAVEALRTLGYSKNAAVMAVRGVRAQARHGNLETAELVKAALRQAIVKVV